MQSQCVLCEKAATTKEHIIPKWIQKAFDLSTLKLRLWNGTFIPYNQVVIPLCQNCNGEILSRLENRIQNGTASPNDYFLWALKIRFCLSIKDRTLFLDRSNPAAGPLLPEDKALVGATFVKHAFLNFERPGFHFNPNPFGSVFLFDNPLQDQQFGFADVPEPFWGITITLPNRKILSVLFTDRGLVRKEISRLFKRKGGLDGFLKLALQESNWETSRLLMLKLMIWQYKFKNIPYGVHLEREGIRSHRVPKQPNYRSKLKKAVLVDMTRLLGYPEDVANDLYNSLPVHFRD